MSKSEFVVLLMLSILTFIASVLSLIESFSA